MSKYMEAGKAHFKELVSSEPRCVEVPEWPIDGQPMKIYYKPTMNFKDQGVVLKLHGENKPAEAVCMTLILKAMDADGNKMFRRMDLEEMMRTFDPEIVSRVVAEMSEDDGVTVEDARKN